MNQIQTQAAETAQHELSSLAAQCDGWSDDQRREFDQARMAPLLALGSDLVQAARKADTELERVQRLLRE